MMFSFMEPRFRVVPDHLMPPGYDQFDLEDGTIAVTRGRVDRIKAAIERENKFQTGPIIDLGPDYYREIL